MGELLLGSIVLICFDIPILLINTSDMTHIVTILGPTTNFPLFSAILFHALSHSFPTRSLMCHSDRHQIT